jgi:hypothetical protein
MCLQNMCVEHQEMIKSGKLGDLDFSCHANDNKTGFIKLKNQEIPYHRMFCDARFIDKISYWSIFLGGYKGFHREDLELCHINLDSYAIVWKIKRNKNIMKLFITDKELVVKTFIQKEYGHDCVETGELKLKIEYKKFPSFEGISRFSESMRQGPLLDVGDQQQITTKMRIVIITAWMKFLNEFMTLDVSPEDNKLIQSCMFYDPLLHSLPHDLNGVIQRLDGELLGLPFCYENGVIRMQNGPAFECLVSGTYNKPRFKLSEYCRIERDKDNDYQLRIKIGPIGCCYCSTFFIITKHKFTIYYETKFGNESSEFDCQCSGIPDSQSIEQFVEELNKMKLDYPRDVSSVVNLVNLRLKDSIQISNNSLPRNPSQVLQNDNNIRQLDKPESNGKPGFGVIFLIILIIAFIWVILML